MKKDIYIQKAVKYVNEMIDGEDVKKPINEKLNSLLTRTKRGIKKDTDKETDIDEPIMKVIRYVKHFRKLREDLKNVSS